MAIFKKIPPHPCDNCNCGTNDYERGFSCFYHKSCEKRKNWEYKYEPKYWVIRVKRKEYDNEIKTYYVSDYHYEGSKFITMKYYTLTSDLEYASVFFEPSENMNKILKDFIENKYYVSEFEKNNLKIYLEEIDKFDDKKKLNKFNFYGYSYFNPLDLSKCKRWGGDYHFKYGDEEMKEENKSEKKYWCIATKPLPLIWKDERMFYILANYNGDLNYDWYFDRQNNTTYFYETEEDMKKIFDEFNNLYVKPIGNHVEIEICECPIDFVREHNSCCFYNYSYLDPDNHDNDIKKVEDKLLQEKAIPLSDYKSPEDIINPKEDDNCTGLLENIKYEYTQDDINNINLRKAKARQDTNMLLDGKLNRDNYLAVWDNENKLFGIGKFEYHTIYTLNIANPDKYRKVYTLKELRELSHKNTDIEINKVEEHIKKYHKK